MDDRGQSVQRGFPRSAVAAYFGSFAKIYGAGEYFRRRRAAAIAAIATEVGRAGNILDLGCGNGALLRDLVAIGTAAKLVGVDLTADMISQARARLGDRVRFAQADASALPFKPAAWDLVVCNHVLQFVGDVNRCVAGVARCLKPGGAFVTTLEGGAIRHALGTILSPEQLREFVGTVLVAERRPGVRNYGYGEAFRDAGLEIETRQRSFAITWQIVEEWVRVRWIPVASQAGRDHIEQLLARLNDDEGVRSRTAENTERLLIGRKPMI